MKEEWRSIVVNGKENPWYSVSNLGNVRSHVKRKSFGIGKGTYTSYDPIICRNLTPFKQKRANGSIAKLNINIQFPKDFFEDYQYRKSSNFTVTKDCSVHQLVMGAFRPMDEYPPERLKEDWKDIPESAKIWIKQTVTINHRDHNPCNNCVDNLEYVSQRENIRAAIKHYGGKLSNKNKEDEWLKITDPVFNPLLQEWEDGKVEFIGSEGEKYYKMLENTARESGKSINEIYFGAMKMLYDKLKKEECEFK